MILKDWLTENNGTSYCPIRIAFLLSILAYFTGTVHDAIYVTGFQFTDHAKDWASGLADLLGFGGAAVAGKAYTENGQ